MLALNPTWKTHWIGDNQYKLEFATRRKSLLQKKLSSRISAVAQLGETRTETSGDPPGGCAE